jgi:hypothetical protein
VAVAIISVVVSGAVAILVPVISGRLEGRRALFALDQARLDNFRTVLDAAAENLSAEMYALNGCWSILHWGRIQAAEETEADLSHERQPNAAITSQFLADELGVASTKLTESWRCLQRMVLRIGRDAAVVGEYKRAHDLCSQAFAQLLATKEGETPFEESDDARLQQLLAEADRGEASFLDAAAKLLGPRSVEIERSSTAVSMTQPPS